MKHLFRIYITLCITAAIFLIGCSSSEESTNKQETPPPAEVKKAPEQPIVKQEPPVVKKIDTVNVDIQNQQKPIYEPKPTVPPPMQNANPSGKYSVQIGAYKMPDNADRIASLAKERFNLNVYTSVDKLDNLYKVMIGDFNSKDEARNFRDEMARKFPSDYKDAWVSENPQK
jgi:cell division septation protein DedD